MLFVSILLLYSHPHPQNYSSLSSHSGCEASGNGICYDEKPDNPDVYKRQELGDANLLKGRKAFDVIIANINRNILLADLPHYAACMHPGDVYKRQPLHTVRAC